MRLLLVLLVVFAACSDATEDPLAPSQPVDPARVRIIVPEVYELANVIIAMTTYGQGSPFLVLKGTPYYDDVYATFSPYRSSPVMAELQLGNDDPLRRYYEIRDNSYAWVFDGDVIKRNPSYTDFWRPNTFRERLSAVQRFSDMSSFRTFFDGHRDYYRAFTERYRALAEIDTMANWLEREFAPRRYDHYTVVLSPLVYGSHSTTRVNNEIIMFVSGPDVTSAPTTSAGVQKLVLQRLVFTEVDHNFVNPVTDQHQASVISAFGTRSKWTTDNTSFYTTPVAVFNEYMTWAVFLLYAESRLSPADFATVFQMTTQQMENSRRFQRFGAFAQKLLELYRARPAGATVSALYPAILSWASQQP